MPEFPPRVRIVEVGPRDGLQNEAAAVSTETKVQFINRLSATGLSTIEATSFVSPRWVPQLADAEAVYAAIDRPADVSYPVLVPNERGMQRALAAGVEEIALFTAASETFNRKNINAGIAESISRFAPVAELARQHAIRMRGYVSCVLGCPYEGAVDPAVVRQVTGELLALGCYEVSLGDTIGVGTPLQAQQMLATVAAAHGIEHLAIHFHDTRGQALANIFACLELGVGVVDSAVAGLGGCPYAHGASGNVATEDLVYMLHGMGIETGVDLERLLGVARFISEALNRDPASRLARLGSMDPREAANPLSCQYNLAHQKKEKY